MSKLLDFICGIASFVRDVAKMVAYARANPAEIQKFHD